MNNKYYMFIGAYVFYDKTNTLQYGAEYGMAANEKAFIRSMEDGTVRALPGASGFQGSAWRMSDKGMSTVARAYMQRYVDQELDS